MAKALLDAATKQPPRPRAPALGAGDAPLDAPTITSLLRFREDCLTAEVAAAMMQASKAAAPQGKKAAAAAVTEAYEANLDLALALGWAHVDRITYEVRSRTRPRHRLGMTPCMVNVCCCCWDAQACAAWRGAALAADLCVGMLLQVVCPFLSGPLSYGGVS